MLAVPLLGRQAGTLLGLVTRWQLAVRGHQHPARMVAVSGRRDVSSEEGGSSNEVAMARGPTVAVMGIARRGWRYVRDCPQ